MPSKTQTRRPRLKRLMNPKLLPTMPRLMTTVMMIAMSVMMLPGMMAIIMPTQMKGAGG